MLYIIDKLLLCSAPSRSRPIKMLAVDGLSLSPIRRIASETRGRKASVEYPTTKHSSQNRMSGFT